MERLLDWPRWRWWRIPQEEMAWAPSIDMYEKEDSFIVRAELPGVNKEDVDISMSGDTLTIKGERKAPANVKAEEYQCCEVYYGSFSRSTTMPAAVDPGNTNMKRRVRTEMKGSNDELSQGNNY